MQNNANILFLCKSEDIILDYCLSFSLSDLNLSKKNHIFFRLKKKKTGELCLESKSVY